MEFWLEQHSFCLCAVRIGSMEFWLEQHSLCQRRRVEDHRPKKVRCRTEQRRTKLVRRGVNATGRLRFLDPMAARAREKSVAFP
jgi:hypothetical protein